MSLASYIGTNVEIPVNEHIFDEDFNEDFWIGPCFAMLEDLETVRECHFSTRYVYEISSNWGIEIVSAYERDVESIEKLQKLTAFLNDYLKKGDYFQLYSCWVGEEQDKSEGKLTIQLNTVDFNDIEIPEKTVVTFHY